MLKSLARSQKVLSEWSNFDNVFFLLLVHDTISGPSSAHHCATLNVVLIVL